MRKMSGGREKLQLHTMNRGEFPWAWKRIIKGILAHFHSPRSVSFCHPQRLQIRSPARSNIVTYLMPTLGARVSFFPTLLELCPFWGNSIFISKVCKCSEAAQFKMVASRLTWVFYFKFELIEMKWKVSSSFTRVTFQGLSSRMRWWLPRRTVQTWSFPSPQRAVLVHLLCREPTEQIWMEQGQLGRGWLGEDRAFVSLSFTSNLRFSSPTSTLESHFSNSPLQ